MIKLSGILIIISLINILSHFQSSPLGNVKAANVCLGVQSFLIVSYKIELISLQFGATT